MLIQEAWFSESVCYADVLDYSSSLFNKGGNFSIDSDKPCHKVTLSDYCFGKLLSHAIIL